jgi:hypothetical protein
MKIYIYKAESDNPEPEDELIASFEGSDNTECEEWASDNYGDTDVYYWAYTSWTN